MIEIKSYHRPQQTSIVGAGSARPFTSYNQGTHKGCPYGNHYRAGEPCPYDD